MKPGLPQLSPPPFSATVGNHTYTFVEMASTLGSAIFVVPLLSILENIALAKVFCKFIVIVHEKDKKNDSFYKSALIAEACLLPYTSERVLPSGT